MRACRRGASSAHTRRQPQMSTCLTRGGSSWGANSEKTSFARVSRASSSRGGRLAARGVDVAATNSTKSSGAMTSSGWGHTRTSRWPPSRASAMIAPPSKRREASATVEPATPPQKSAALLRWKASPSASSKCMRTRERPCCAAHAKSNEFKKSDMSSAATNGRPRASRKDAASICTLGLARCTTTLRVGDSFADVNSTCRSANSVLRDEPRSSPSRIDIKTRVRRL
mmetsp:Transcript_17035/g.53162  ORF Transcript_17035/g.53162 Transcript_17035/m.53162 type:complete len:227 (+) Transcript_17035:431-1111(+)